MSTRYPHPRSVLLQLAELRGGSLYAVRYEALRLSGLDVPNWPDCRQPRNRALRRLALDRLAPAKMRLAALKALLWGLDLDAQERQEAELRAMRVEAAAISRNRPYTKTARWYAQRGLPNPGSGQPATSAPQPSIAPAVAPEGR